MLLFLTLPIDKYIYYSFLYDEYDTSYEEIWKSDDGKITITVDNRRGMYGVGRYKGIYNQNENDLEIEVVIDGISYARSLDGKYIYSGESFHNIFCNSYTIYVDEVNRQISDYNVGDTIVFKKQ